MEKTLSNKVSFIFDTETNGFANCSVLSISFIISHNGQVLDKDTRYYFAKEKYNYYAAKVHGLTKDILESKREDCNYPLYFDEDYEWLIDIIKKYKVEVFVAHNTSFDIKFLPEEIKQMIKKNQYLTYCTMRENKEFVGLKKDEKYKYPSLEEACVAYKIEFCQNKAHASDYDTLKAYELFVATMDKKERDKQCKNN